MACRRTGAVLRVAPVDDAGALDTDAFAALLNERTHLVAVTHLSNALSTIAPVQRIIALAHAQGVPVLHYAKQAMADIPDLTVVGTAADKAGILSFKLDESTSMTSAPFSTTAGSLSAPAITARCP